MRYGTDRFYFSGKLWTLVETEEKERDKLTTWAVEKKKNDDDTAVSMSVEHTEIYVWSPEWHTIQGRHVLVLVSSR